MIFILAVLITIAAFFVWRNAARKVKQDNPLSSQLAPGVFSP